MNIPFGVISCLGVFFLVPTGNKEPLGNWRAHLKELDPLGVCLLTAGVVCLLLGLQLGGSKYEWDSWHIITSFAVAGALLILFCFDQAKLKDRATLPLRIIRNRRIVAVTEYTLCIHGGIFVFSYYVSAAPIPHAGTVFYALEPSD